MIGVQPESLREKRQEAKIKCVVWDLDNTLWEGVLLEGDDLVLRDNVTTIIETLDRRGILQSIASKNDYRQAMAMLSEFGLKDYFLFPQIGWDSKAVSIGLIAKSLNIGLDTVAFIDDQAFEREEVRYSLPDVRCLDPVMLDQLLEMPEMNPDIITADAEQRRLMYISEIERKQAEAEFRGPAEAFLATLEMVLTISRAREEDLLRAEELTLRTHQLNTTGYTYSHDELSRLRVSDDYLLLTVDLEDRFGSYGKIGLALIQCEEKNWIIKLLLMSCRVMSRGSGAMLISHILQQAKAANARLQAEFVANDRNRMMYVTYKFAGFKEIKREGSFILLENPLTHTQPFPPYVDVRIEN